MEEDVFKALGDVSRRTLLDALFMKDGQTLGELCNHLQMTRFGVMKHLQVLEDAGIIITQKVGREKYHYLNPVPIQQVYERWVGKYAQSWVEGLTHLKSMLEGTAVPDRHILQIYIQTTPERLWRALTESDFTEHYYFGSRVESDWLPGSPYQYPIPSGGTFVKGEVIESDPPRRLVTTFKPVWQYPDGEPPISQVTWEIEPLGAVCKLTLIHDQLDLSSAKSGEIIEGWARITSGLKTWLETGKSLDVAGQSSLKRASH